MVNLIVHSMGLVYHQKLKLNKLRTLDSSPDLLLHEKK